MKRVLIYMCVFAALASRAQQTNIYTQYLFNKAGFNPAASGTEINQKYNYVFGINRQWVGFDHAPKTNFFNVSMTIRPPRSYRLWQNVGIYVESEETGIFSTSAIYANYTVHVLVRRTWVASFGAYVGLKTFFISEGTLDKMDPINQSNSYQTFMYPDVIPGFRLSNKRFFFDISARQITINRLKDFNGNHIGGPSSLNPVLSVGVGRKIPLSEMFMLLPSLAVNASVLHVPAVNLNVMLYYNTRMGAGVALRNLSFLSLIYQVRIVRNFSVGVAYSSSLNSVRYAAPNSFEVMLGVTPLGMIERASGRHSVARCPGLDY